MVENYLDIQNLYLSRWISWKKQVDLCFKSYFAKYEPDLAIDRKGGGNGR